LVDCPPKILELIERFDRHIDDYRSGKYKEAEVRNEFIDPMFSALGWDMENRQGHAEAYKEVIHEHSIKVHDAHKAPDYCFRIGGVRKFFLEAKKPAVNIKHDIGPAFQVRRYAWSAKLPLSILTDFEELAVYDCRIKPVKTDKASVGRVLYMKYDQYRDKWGEIASIFSKDAVYKGSFDKYVESAKRKKGTQEVDSSFLKDIESWRDILAKNIALRNPRIPQRELNYAVQTTIDRLIFLRICEDRGIEDYSRLLGAVNGDGIYQRLFVLFSKADERYNSGLFHFKKEKGRDSDPDELTPGLKIDDQHLKSLIKSLYYPGPYEFSMMPPEILGQVYEQFLGKVIRLTKGGQAKVEEKPEVKKAGGVYYTPRYIVDYIVKNTVGKLLEGKTPKQAAKLKILDPACGSGSFLIGAYQYLLDWHLEQYAKAPGKYKKVIYKVPALVTLSPSKGEHEQGDQKTVMVSLSNPEPVPLRQAQGDKNGSAYADKPLRRDVPDWRLTIQERKRILLNNIHGVDIDTQAVEVTKLSLLLKVLEQETDETINQSLRLFHERALPDLSDNIKCGNSLIGPDFYEGEQQSMFMDDEERYRINAFDWHTGFPEVFNGKTPGFDAVIGNPPYRRELAYKSLLNEIASTHFGNKYRAPRMDLWYYFVHRALELLIPNGKLSFIVNAYWTSGTGAEKLIAELRDNTHIDEIFFFNKLKVFNKVSGQHMILRVINKSLNKPTTIKLVEPKDETTAEPFVIGNASLKVFKKTTNQLFRNLKIDLYEHSGELFDKFKSWVDLYKLGDIRQGIAENPASINRKTNEKYGNRWKINQGVFALQKEELEKLKLPKSEQKLIRPYFDLCDLGRYAIASKPSLFLIYSTRKTCPNIKMFPNIQKHLAGFKIIMLERRETKKGSNSWWHLHWPRDKRLWESPKIISIQMGSRPNFAPSHGPVYVPFSTNVFVPFDETSEDILYITGILNSRLIWKWYIHNAKRRGVGLEINGNVLSRTPIRTINFSNKQEKAQHDKMVKLVEQMLSLNKKLAKLKTPHEKNVIQRQIDHTDKQIDSLVYKLYGLTDKEIKIVEENTK